MPVRAMPVSRLSTEAPAVVDELSEGAGPVVLTVDGEARAVLQDIADYERDQRALAILKLAAYGRKSRRRVPCLRRMRRSRRSTPPFRRG